MYTGQEKDTFDIPRSLSVILRRKQSMHFGGAGSFADKEALDFFFLFFSYCNNNNNNNNELLLFAWP